MKEVFDKLSSYNIFNYLLPGILFVAITKYFIGYNFILENDFLGVFLYYFIGMILSRFGSIIIEPILKKIKFLNFSDYKDFITASEKDSEINLLSEVNNTYRSITSMMFWLIILKGYHYLDVRWHYSKEITFSIAMFLIFLMFLFAYRKQTNYITKRITRFKDQ